MTQMPTNNQQSATLQPECGVLGDVKTICNAAMFFGGLGGIGS